MKQQPQHAPSLMANTDSMSTLKTIAQEAINRSTSLDNNSILSSTNLQATSTSMPTNLTDHRSQMFSNDTNIQINGPHSGSNHNNNAIISNNLLKPNVLGSGTNEAHIPPLLGVVPLGPCPLKKEYQLQFQMMEAAEYHLPQPMDSERLRTYLHRQPVQTPSSYPQVDISENPFQSLACIITAIIFIQLQSQLPHSDTFEFFQRLSTETLYVFCCQ